MAPDDFGTVNVRRGDRTREIEVIRQQYRRHREALQNMLSDAPTEHLAAEYKRLIAEIDGALRKLDELEGRDEAQPPAAAASPKPNFTDTQPAFRPEAGKKPLVASPAAGVIPEEAPTQARSRIAAILLAGIAVLVVIGWLLWRASSDERPAKPILSEDRAAETATVAEEPPPPPAPKAALSVEPASQDFGTVRKGTRAVRQFEIANNTDQPVAITVARSTCRCLYYDYAPTVPPNGKETISVTIDGVRAKSGALQEALKVSSKTDPSVTATLNVTGTVK